MVSYTTATEAFTQKEIESFRGKTQDRPLSDEELLISVAIERYLLFRNEFPNNGDVDIEWQENGMGLYGHLRRWYQVKDECSAAAFHHYSQDIIEELQAMVEADGGHYVAENVLRCLEGYRVAEESAS